MLIPDRENVIKAWEDVLSRDPLDAPWDLIDDTLALLKAQEPRVLTREESEKAEVCWLEVRGYEPYATLEAGDWNPEKYGKSYRCWNRMPTDEQRKAVKWDARIV